MKNRKLLTLLSVGLALILVLSFVGACAKPAPATTVTLKAVCGMQVGHVQCEAFNKALAWIEERSNGAIVIDYTPGPALYSMGKTTEPLIANVVQLGVIWLGYAPERFGMLAEIGTAPFAWNSERFNNHWRDSGLYYDYMEPICNQNSLHLLVR